ncbi:MAG: DUF5615 family PIN-like protein [Bryobacteraceae bacterium]
MIALYLDEDVSRHQLVWALRSRGFDVLTSFEAGMNGQCDDSQLAFAASQGRLLLTANARDFAQLHQEWMCQGRTHAGVVFVPQQRYSTGEIVRRLLRVAASGAGGTSDLYYLSNF